MFNIFKPVKIFLEGGIMNKFLSGLAVLMIFSFCAGSAFAEYDQSTVKSVMKKNVSTMGSLKRAVEASDFKGAETAFRTFANDMKELTKMTPPKGTKEEWDAVISEFVDAAQKGADASVQKDSAKIKEVLNNLQALQKKGHMEFKG